MGTVTVKRAKRGFVIEFSILPGQSFGPFSAAEAARDLTVSALLSANEARALVMDASSAGSATCEVGGAS